ncbi:MAG TPA: hypothetical protein VME68_05205 [Acidobacteriaceae bacterium]|nr:hypothetical protein [Acidobacteriaceae bacterium]
MGSAAAAHRQEKSSPGSRNGFDLPESDVRCQVAQRVVASRHFARSPLLSRFLLYIVAETVAGRATEITEHQIGVHVFDRPANYRTVEDNIVRNYARQLRRRLSEYFAEEGAQEEMHIDIPLGGYIPVFLPAADDARAGVAARPAPISIRAEAPTDDEAPTADLAAPIRQPNRRAAKALLGLLYTAVIFGAAWFAAMRIHPPGSSVPSNQPTEPLWAALFKGPLSTYIVPADAGLNLIEDISRRPLPLTGYINGDYAGIALPQVDAHSADDLRTQDFTSFVDLQIISSLAHLPEFDPQRAILRFPRDLRVDDLKHANAVILGSVGSNPWAAIAETNANFRIVYREGMQGATIVNTHPQPGEAAEYVSHWNEPAHETFALISCLPNLEGNGRLLVLQGLDVAGTQAAGEALFHPAAVASILRSATRKDGTMGYFEILLRARSIESNATGMQVIGSRIY